MDNRSLTLNISSYENVRCFLRILSGTQFSQYISMMNDIMGHVGSSQSQTNWKDPDEWIPQRLGGKSQDLALELWRESNHLVNPRHSYDIRAFANHHGLALFREDGIQITERGQRFVDKAEAVIESIDEIEGLHFVLREIADKGPCRRLDLIGSFTSFCQPFTTWNAGSSIDLALSARVRHLKERNLIERVGHAYQITDAGLKHLRQLTSGGLPDLSSPGLRDLAKKTNDTARTELEDFVRKMNPYLFEHVIKRLLEAMGYEDVEVTSGSNDKGVDVVADIELGISRVREVIQVKRQQNNVGIEILDRLRGSLHRFDAVRGTVITTSGFTRNAKSAAFDKGAAPITLIDGQTLFDFMIENDIGIRRREIKIMEFDEASLGLIDPDGDADLQVEA